MPPASPLCSFHEERLNDLNDQVGAIKATQASFNTKLDQIQTGTNTIVGKIDTLLEKTEAVADKVIALEGRTKKIEDGQEAAKKIALKVIPPIGVALLGVLAGASGPGIWKSIMSLFGG